MDRFKAWLFNRKACAKSSKPDEVMEALYVHKGQHIVDVGVGGGYFTLRFAEQVGESGRVYAVDTNRGLLSILREKGVSNIKILSADRILEDIPKDSVDLVFLRNVYHHLENRVQYFRGITPLLKRDGRIAIIDYKECKGFSFHRMHGHYVPKAEIMEEMRQSGYAEEYSFNFLPEQSYTIFKKKK